MSLHPATSEMPVNAWQCCSTSLLCLTICVFWMQKMHKQNRDYCP
uniref:Uncharacterized protein n=1 Tax=Anguilla anguilla TaxID=7936 RepID=A0A0E9RSM9_ANGAN